MKLLQRLSAIAIVVVFLCLAGGCMHWRWSECRGVGHGIAYCLMDMGR